MRYWLLSLSFLGVFSLSAQKAQKVKTPVGVERPKIVIGMVVDQMCWDYLYRYQSKFVDGGFRRLLTEGFNCDNTRINYIPSVTAIGHTTVYTGSVPAIHGIAGNDFFVNDRPMYCTQDTTVASVGVPNGKSGQMSPRNMLVTTITDELRLATNFRSRVIGVALKDRGAILPAGHSANAAYWFDDKSGYFISSTYYMDKLPEWVNKFNAQKLPEKYLSKGWYPLYPIESYKEAQADANDYENPWGKNFPATLPLRTDKFPSSWGVGSLRGTPWGNTITLDFAKAALEAEGLGLKGADTDFLAISLSSTDYMGHRYGTNSVEGEDMYLRLDQELAAFFSYLDKRFGRDGYVFFLTADHAGAHNVSFMEDHKLPAGAFSNSTAYKLAQSIAEARYPEAKGLVLKVANYQVYINRSVARQHKVDLEPLLEEIAIALEQLPGVSRVVPSARVNQYTLQGEIRMRIENGYKSGRSGELFIVLESGWYGAGNRPKGTSHAVWAPYDTHIPLIFMGANIPQGHLKREVYMTDIAPTLSMLLGIELPSGAVGKPIVELLDAASK